MPVSVSSQSTNIAQNTGFSRPDSMVPPMKKMKPSSPSTPMLLTRWIGRRVWTSMVCI